MDPEGGPPWVPCDCCGQWACSVHERHVYECACLPVEYWARSPYDERPRPCACGATHEYGEEPCDAFMEAMTAAERGA